MILPYKPSCPSVGWLVGCYRFIWSTVSVWLVGCIFFRLDNNSRSDIFSKVLMLLSENLFLMSYNDLMLVVHYNSFTVLLVFFNKRQNEKSLLKILTLKKGREICTCVQGRTEKLKRGGAKIKKNNIFL